MESAHFLLVLCFIIGGLFFAVDVYCIFRHVLHVGSQWCITIQWFSSSNIKLITDLGDSPQSIRGKFHVEDCHFLQVARCVSAPQRVFLKFVGSRRSLQFKSLSLFLGTPQLPLLSANRRQGCGGTMVWNKCTHSFLMTVIFMELTWRGSRKYVKSFILEPCNIFIWLGPLVAAYFNACCVVSIPWAMDLMRHTSEHCVCHEYENWKKHIMNNIQIKKYIVEVHIF